MKKHIITFCHHTFVVDSATAATQALGILSKLLPAKHVTDGEYEDWHYVPDDCPHRQPDVSVKMNQPWREPRKPKPKPEKPLRLPKPKKGSILCICEKSHVAPKETCPHCGRPFAESHNRTHGDAREVKPQFRLL